MEMFLLWGYLFLCLMKLMNDGGILFTAVDKRIFNECSIKIHRIACMRAINSFPINTTRRSPLLGILIKSKRESFSVRFSKLEKYFILLTQVWAGQAREDWLQQGETCSRETEKWTRIDQLLLPGGQGDFWCAAEQIPATGGSNLRRTQRGAPTRHSKRI